MPLAGYKSLCADHAPIIKSSDRGNPQSHIANNIDKSYVTHYQIDGVVMTSGTRCDFLVINEDKKTVYFIELKGSDILKAATQIEATESYLASQLKYYSGRQYRIIPNRVNTHDLKSSAFRRYQIRWGKNLVVKTSQLTENI